MNVSNRKILDKAFTALAYSSLAAMALAVVLFLAPIIWNGAGAFAFTATVEHEKFLGEVVGDDLSESEKTRIAEADAAREPLYKMMSEYENPASAKALERGLDEAFAKSAAGMPAESDEIFAALKLGGAARAKTIRAASEKFWKPYVSALKREVADASAAGTSFALAEILARQEGEIADAVRGEIAELGKIRKLTFSEKSALRRNAGEIPSEKIAEALAVLEENNRAYETLSDGIAELLGPRDSAARERAKLLRRKYGQTRLDNARAVLENSVNTITVRGRDASGAEFLKRVSSAEYFRGTPVEKIVAYVDGNFDAMLHPHFALYLGFLFDDPYDSNIFGGIFPMILGTFYLTFGSMLIAAPLGIIAAIYFAEYARNGRVAPVLRMCVGTLAGVPSIVFGLFGLAFLINTVKVSESKSVLAGAITLALLILPTIIRSCEEALKAVPNSYREAALGLGAGKWRAICTVILPAALPSMLTGIIISMGRAAGETAPIIFTAATSTGAALALSEVFTQATPALPWNIYNICSEHEMAERVAHVQYGMVLTLISIVLLLNGVAIWVRARMRSKMKS